MDPSVSAVVHASRSLYFKEEKDFAEFYKSSLLYLAFISSDALLESVRLVRGDLLCSAALARRRSSVYIGRERHGVAACAACEPFVIAQCKCMHPLHSLHACLMAITCGCAVFGGRHITGGAARRQHLQLWRALIAPHRASPLSACASSFGSPKRCYVPKLDSASMSLSTDVLGLGMPCRCSPCMLCAWQGCNTNMHCIPCTGAAQATHVVVCNADQGAG